MSNYNAFPSLDGLVLTNFERSTAERKLSGQTEEGRCQVMASILEVPGLDLTKLVKYWLAKLPADSGNRWSHREDLEQSIYRKLIARREDLQGEWPLVCEAIKGEYQSWYKTFTRQRNLGDFQAISLDREYAKNGDGLAVDAAGESNPIETVIGILDANAVLDALPDAARGVLQKRLAGTALTEAERARWSRFMGNSRNVANVLGLLSGNLESKPIWTKPGRPKKPVTV